jgi:hydroxyethylthiazole kinase-like uncharacterized protein yjeF
MDQFKKILSAQQTREADAYTIENEPITSIELMERASLAFVEEIEGRLASNQRIAVVCGPGNNGGDGFAITRLLKERGYQVEAYLVGLSDHLSLDCQINKERLKKVKLIEDSVPSFDTYDVLIDAIFGSGLTRPINSGVAEQVVNAMNQSQNKIYSVDIPSGLFCDEVMRDGVAIKSDLTVSFQRPKLSFFFTESEPYISEWKVVDIGLNEEFIEKQKSAFRMLGEDVSKLVKSRDKFSHKGKYGRALMMAGSYGMIGAAVLSSKACLRSGAGLLTAYVPKCGYDILQTSVPEAMCMTDEEKHLTHLPDISTFDCVGVGPGIGKNEETKRLIHELFVLSTQPLVLDADALNLIAEDDFLKSNIPSDAILTPHPLEFKRLVGDWKDSAEKLQKQVDFSQKNNCVVVLKGAHTSISSPDGNVYFNLTGNPGMATAGSGDVLTGIITGLRAQGYSAVEAALMGVHFHGKSGDAAKVKIGENGMIASDLITHLRIEKN